jgi:hypothetical protein
MGSSKAVMWMICFDMTLRYQWQRFTSDQAEQVYHQPGLRAAHPLYPGPGQLAPSVDLHDRPAVQLVPRVHALFGESVLHDRSFGNCSACARLDRQVLGPCSAAIALGDLHRKAELHLFPDCHNGLVPAYPDGLLDCP